jgi:hypothetical protein
MKKILLTALAFVFTLQIVSAQEETAPESIELITCADISNEKCKPIGETREFKLVNSQTSFFLLIRLNQILPTEKLYIKIVRNGKIEKPYFVDWLVNYEAGKIDNCLSTNVVIRHTGDYVITILDEDQRQEFGRTTLTVGGMKAVNTF